MSRKTHRRATDWDGVAAWYDGWMGKKGSEHHRRFAVPALMRLASVRPGQHILDIGCGQGVLAPYIQRAQAQYTGVDASPRLLTTARRRHGDKGRFIAGDARLLHQNPALRGQRFQAAVFLLSIQNMEPLDQVLQSAARLLVAGGRLALLMTHPCFRQPRQSGWGWDPNRRLRYRRIDRYLTPFRQRADVQQNGRGSSTLNFHRPLEAYINALAAAGLAIDRLQEIPVASLHSTARPTPAEIRANNEIPLFMGIRAIKT